MSVNFKANIWKFYLFKVFTSFALFVPIMVLFWQDNGLSFTEIMLLQSVFSISVVLFEIPSGYFADIFGRKNALILASLAFPVAIFLYAISHSFWIFLLGEISMAFALSMISGADAAFLFDTLKEVGRENEYTKFWGNATAIRFITIAVSNVVGGFLGQIDFRLTFYAVLPFAFCLLPLSRSMIEPARYKLVIKKNYAFTLIKIIKTHLIDNLKIRWLIIYSSIIYLFFQSALWFYQPYMSLSGLEIIHFGLIFASFQIVAAISSKYASRIEKFFGRKTSLILLMFIVATSNILLGSFVFTFSFLFAFLHQFVRGFKLVVISNYINSLVKSDVRATVLSGERFIENIFFAIFIPFIGWFADVYTLLQAFLLMGISVFVIGGVILIFMHRNKLF